MSATSSRSGAPSAATRVAAALAAGAAVAVWADVAASGRLAAADVPLRARAVTWRGPAVVSASRAVTATGGASGRTVVAALSLAWHVRRLRRRALIDDGLVSLPLLPAGTMAAALPVAVALVLAPVTSATLKRLVRRERPPRAEAVISEDDPSFPSGHAAGSAAVAVTMAATISAAQGAEAPLALPAALPLAALPLAALPLAAWSATIGATRVHLGVHWPTDVLAGWAAGTAVGLVALEVADLLKPPVPDGCGRRAGSA